MLVNENENENEIAKSIEIGAAATESESGYVPVAAAAASTTTKSTDLSLPSRLSPSRMSDFKKCPKSFHFKSVLRIPTETTIAQLKGTLVHLVLERLFDLPRDSRTPAAAIALIPVCLSELNDNTSYTKIIQDNFSLLSSESQELITKYFAMENPTNFDPTARELWVHGKVEEMPIVGVIDRLDTVHNSDGSITSFISDYKTGKLPAPRYRAEAFFAMKVYALLQNQANKPVNRLRLIYIKEAERKAVLRLEITPAILKDTLDEVSQLVTSIKTAHANNSWPAIVNPLCNWCDFKPICPAHTTKDNQQISLRVSPW